MVSDDDTTKRDDAVHLRLWESFTDVAEQWKQQHGVETPQRGLLPSRSYSARKPWQCAGSEVQDPVDLLRKLEGFEPYDQLEGEHGRGAILASICLAHAAGAPNTHLLREDIVDKAKAALQESISRTRTQIAALKKGVKRTADLMGPSYKRGVEYSRQQAEKGRKGGDARWKGNEARDAVKEFITELVALTDGWGDPLPPEELWPRLYARMDSKGMNPREHNDPPRYECDGLCEPLTKDAFRRRIQRARQ